MSDEQRGSDDPAVPAADAPDSDSPGDTPPTDDGHAADGTLLPDGGSADDGRSEGGKSADSSHSEDSDPVPDGGPPSDGGSASGPGDAPRDSITEGGLVGPLFRLAWPIVVVQLLQVTYNVVDVLYLGRLSADAVGALSLAFPLVFLLISIAAGFTTAGAILVAQYTGAGGDRSAGLVVGQTVTFVGLLSVVIAGVGFTFTRPALELLPSDPETTARVIPLAADYMEVLFLGVPLMFGFFVFSAVMRGYGNVRVPMAVMVVSALANVLLNPFLIFGFDGNPLFTWLGLGGLEATLFAATGFTGLAIEGAALATVLTRGLATVTGLALLFGTGVGPSVSLAHLRPNVAILDDIVRLGAPSMVEQSTRAMAMITLTAVVVTFAPPVVAAYGLVNRIVSLVFLPAMGLGRAIDTIVGQNLGAQQEERAARSVWLAVTAGAGIMLVVAVVAVTVTEPIVGVFIGDVPDAPATIDNSVAYLRTRAAEFAFIGVTQVLLGAFRGAGNTKIAMVISIVTLWVGRVGSVCLLVFGLGWGTTGVWVGMAVGNVLGAAIAVPWFLRGTWRERYIDEDRIDEPTVPGE